jgi:hypothetical protein
MARTPEALAVLACALDLDRCPNARANAEYLDALVCGRNTEDPLPQV